MKKSARGPVLSERSESNGFTLVELLVVVAIIGILAVIGITIFAGIFPKVRNDRRLQDLDALQKALEVHKTPLGYLALNDSQFASEVIPTKDSQGNVYCANGVVNTQPTTPIAAWTTTCPTGFSPVGISPPAGTLWKICVWLEAEGVTAAKAVCKKNAQ